jgi:hypothetical protein
MKQKFPEVGSSHTFMSSIFVWVLGYYHHPEQLVPGSLTFGWKHTPTPPTPLWGVS